MATGRLIFGLGAESLIVAVTTAVAKWFRGKELSFRIRHQPDDRAVGHLVGAEFTDLGEVGIQTGGRRC